MGQQKAHSWGDSRKDEGREFPQYHKEIGGEALNPLHLTGYGVKIKVKNLRSRSDLHVTDGRDNFRQDNRRIRFGLDAYHTTQSSLTVIAATSRYRLSIGCHGTRFQSSYSTMTAQ